MITEEKKEYVEGVELHNHAVWITKEAENQWSIETTELLDFDDGSKGSHLKSNYEVYDFDHAQAVYKREVSYLEREKEAQPQIPPKTMAWMLDGMVMVDKNFPDGFRPDLD